MGRSGGVIRVSKVVGVGDGVVLGSTEDGGLFRKDGGGLSRNCGEKMGEDGWVARNCGTAGVKDAWFVWEGGVLMECGNSSICGVIVEWWLGWVKGNFGEVCGKLVC